MGGGGGVGGGDPAPLSSIRNTEPLFQVLTRILGHPKMSGTGEEGQGNRTVFLTAVAQAILRCWLRWWWAKNQVFQDPQIWQDPDFLDLGRSTLGDFSHPYFSYPRKNTISSDICPRAFSFAPAIIKHSRIKLRTAKSTFFAYQNPGKWTFIQGRDHMRIRRRKRHMSVFFLFGRPKNTILIWAIYSIYIITL